MNINYTEVSSIHEAIEKTVTLNILEFFIYLLIALVVGYLIHYIFSHRRDYFRTPKKNPSFYYSKSLDTSYYPNTEPIILPERIIEVETKSIQNIKKESSEKYTPSNSSRDDLKIIEGIGPKIENLLNKAKINTWYRLSKTNINKLKSILDSAGYQMHDPLTWPEQAYLAETRQWEQLKRLQNNLNGGKHI